MTDKLTFDQIDEIMDMLTGGELPHGMRMPDQPKLMRRQAFSIVWFLQEHTGIIPSHFEMCQVCEELYDSDRGGYWLDPSSEPDDWLTEIGVTPEIFKSAPEGGFCQHECEAKFWHRHIQTMSEATP